MASISSSPFSPSPIALIVSPSTSTSAFHVRSAVTIVPFLMTLLTRSPPSHVAGAARAAPAGAPASVHIDVDEARPHHDDVAAAGSRPSARSCTGTRPTGSRRPAARRSAEYAGRDPRRAARTSCSRCSSVAAYPPRYASAPRTTSQYGSRAALRGLAHLALAAEDVDHLRPRRRVEPAERQLAAAAVDHPHPVRRVRHRLERRRPAFRRRQRQRHRHRTVRFSMTRILNSPPRRPAPSGRATPVCTLPAASASATSFPMRTAQESAATGRRHNLPCRSA